MSYSDSPTVLQMYDAIRKEMRLDPNGRIWSNADLLEAINEALYTVQTATFYGWQDNDQTFTIASIADQAEYDLPETTQQVRLAEYEDVKLWSTNKIQLESVYKTLPNGTPTSYYIYGRKLGLSPTPTTDGDIITVYNQFFLTDMVNDSDIIPFPGKFKKALSTYAAYSLFSQTSDATNTQRANVKKARYNEEINKMRLSYLIPDREQAKMRNTYVSRSNRKRRENGYYNLTD